MTEALARASLEALGIGLHFASLAALLSHRAGRAGRAPCDGGDRAAESHGTSCRPPRSTCCPGALMSPHFCLPQTATPSGSPRAPAHARGATVAPRGRTREKATSKHEHTRRRNDCPAARATIGLQRASAPPVARERRRDTQVPAMWPRFHWATYGAAAATRHCRKLRSGVQRREPRWNLARFVEQRQTMTRTNAAPATCPRPAPSSDRCSSMLETPLR